MLHVVDYDAIKKYEITSVDKGVFINEKKRFWFILKFGLFSPPISWQVWALYAESPDFYANIFLLFFYFYQCWFTRLWRMTPFVSHV